jgi:hypothetical protein
VDDDLSSIFCSSPALGIGNDLSLLHPGDQGIQETFLLLFGFFIPEGEEVGQFLPHDLIPGIPVHPLRPFVPVEDFAFQVHHGDGVPGLLDHRLQEILGGDQLLLQPDFFHHQGIPVDDPVNEEGKRLGAFGRAVDVIEHPFFHGFNGHPGISLAGYKDGGNPDAQLIETPEPVQAFSIGELMVQEENVEFLFPEFLQAFPAGRYRLQIIEAARFLHRIRDHFHEGRVRFRHQNPYLPIQISPLLICPGSQASNLKRAICSQ